MSLPRLYDGFLQKEFFNLSGITMNGQTVSIDFVFDGESSFETSAPVWAELQLQTGPQSPPNPNGDFPYSQYVVFGEGTTASLLDHNGQLLHVPMADWLGGLTTAPAATLAVLHTDHGRAGADMVALPVDDVTVGGVRYNIVLPNSGQTIYSGRISLNSESVQPRRALVLSEDADETDEQSDLLLQPEPFVDSPSGRNFAVSDLGAVVYAASRTGPFLSGYGRIVANAGESASGLAILGYRNSGGLVGETIVPDAPAMTLARFHVEMSADGRISTQVVLTNPNREDATISFDLRNEQGSILRSGQFTLKGTSSGCSPGSPCNQLARFINEDPFLSGRGVIGTMTVFASAPITVFAARWTTTGENWDGVLGTSLPVIDLSMTPAHVMQMIPHFIVGEGRTTELVMVNPTGTALSGDVYFLNPYGDPAYITIDGSSYQSSFRYAIPPNGSQKTTIYNALRGSEYGTLRVVPGGDSPVPSSFITQAYTPAGVTTFSVAVPPTMGRAFRMYAEHSPLEGIRSALAVANAANVAGTVWVSLSGLNGLPLASTSFVIPAGGQIVDYLDSLFRSLDGRKVQGVLRITTDLPGISVVGFRVRQNEQQQSLLSTILPVRENELSVSSERFFPYWLNGGGFSTDIILFSGRPGAHSGNLSFFLSDGSRVDLRLR